MPENQIHISAGRPAASQPFIAEAIRQEIRLEAPSPDLYEQLARDFCDGHVIEIGRDRVGFSDLGLQGVEENGDGRGLSVDEKRIKGRQIFDRLTDKLVESITPLCKDLSVIEIQELCAKTAVQLATTGASQLDGQALLHVSAEAEKTCRAHIVAGEPSKMAIRVVPDARGQGFIVHKRAVFHTLIQKTPVANPLQGEHEYDTDTIAFADKPALITDFRFRMACQRTDNALLRLSGKEKFTVTGAPISFELETPCREYRDSLTATRKTFWDSICNWFAKVFGANCLLCRTECESYDSLESRPSPQAFSEDKGIEQYLRHPKRPDEVLAQDNRVKISYTEPDTLRGEHLFTVFRSPGSFRRQLQEECNLNAAKYQTTEALVAEFQKEMVDRGVTPGVHKINGRPLLPSNALTEELDQRSMRILNEVEEITNNDPQLKHSVLRMLSQFPRNVNESALTLRMHEKFGGGFSFIQAPPPHESIDVIAENGRAVRAICTSSYYWDAEGGRYSMNGTDVKSVPQGAAAHVSVTYEFVDGGLRVAQTKVHVNAVIDAITSKEKVDAEARKAARANVGKRRDADADGGPIASGSGLVR
jgi:hypothetical protein